jgi:glycerophosphoryl diester phosphodiesterase
MLDAPPAGSEDAARSGALPALIAHGAGNDDARATNAIAACADFIEVDLWVHEGRFEARHSRRIPPLPFLFEKWAIQLAPMRPYGLRELLATTPPSTGIFLDLKNGGDTAGRLLDRSITEAGISHQIVASSQDWTVLRALRERCPHVGLFYSVDVQASLDLLFSVTRRDECPRGVSCRHSLLTRGLIERLHEAGLLIAAWTVDDLERGEELASWGVDAITTHRVAAMREHLRGA